MKKSFAIERKLGNEIGLASEIITRKWGLDLKKPNFHFANKTVAEFVKTPTLLSDTAESLANDIVYDEATNEIYAQKKFGESPKSQREFIFLHELTHTALAQLNPSLGNKEILWLIKKGMSTKNKQKGCVYIAFQEGMANYIAIKTSLSSKNCRLASRANSVRQVLIGGFNKYLTVPEIISLPTGLRHRRLEAWRKTLGAHFEKNLKHLMFYRYLVGYQFALAVKPTQKTIQRYIINPPTTIQHLLNPKMYLTWLSTQ